MTTQELCLARKYALAFMSYQQYYDQDIDFFLRLHGLIDFLGQYRDRFFYADKERYLKVVEIFGFDRHAFGLLLDLLVNGKRLVLIRSVLRAMCWLYQKHNALDLCAITSSHQVSDEQLDKLNLFLERASAKTVIYTHRVDRSLIAGIRARGTTFIWEDSVAKRLRLIEQSYE
jgi:F0F1-type ATP synthase delta subunit